MNEVKYTIRTIYGLDRRYPANGMANLVCDLAGTKTLTNDTLKILKKHNVKLVKVL